jgi:hypothetical protein
MIIPTECIGSQVNVEISGRHRFKGILVDTGLDILVIYNGEQFFYIPLNHVQHLELSTEHGQEDIENPGYAPFGQQTDSVSYRKILERARGRFVEIYVSGNKTIHGYITNIMNDYFAFYSPAYKTVYVSLHHLKWIVPYPPNITPYSLNNQSLPVNPSNVAMARVFEQQCKKFEGNLTVFDLGDHPDKIGLLQKVSNNMIELVSASGKTIYWNLDHLKTVHLP